MEKFGNKLSGQNANCWKARMKNEEFKTWLAAGGAKSEKGRAFRVAVLRRIERELRNLGSSHTSLDEAWAADGFTHLRDRLRDMLSDAKNGGQDYRVLMPESEKPQNRLSSWNSYLGQYGRFLAGEAPGHAKDADVIRDYVLKQYIEPARIAGQDDVEVLVSDVNEALGLKQAWPNICQALAGAIFQNMTGLPKPQRIGADQSSATVFRFDLTEATIDRAALELLRQNFLAECPDFQSFAEPGTGWAADEKPYKLNASALVNEAIREAVDDAAAGEALFGILKTSDQSGPLVRWQTQDQIAKEAPALLPEFYGVLGALARSEASLGEALALADRNLMALRDRGATALSFGERINILFTAVSMVYPNQAAPIKIKLFNDAWVLLTGKPLFVEAKADMARDYQAFAKVFAAIFTIAHDEWAWQPTDWLDIQGFLWIALKSDAEITPTPTSVRTSRENKIMPSSPENLILHGPPGTGKTYATAEKAVRLCGVDVPDDREALMATYQELCAAKRIEFVTFHQSMSYEDFIEGRQPTTVGEDGEEGSGGGFRLETVRGTFRRIANRAATSRGHATGADAVTVTGRQVFKMSIGQANDPEESHLFDDAIEGGYTILGFEDIDWSDDKYRDNAEIMAACAEFGTRPGSANKLSGRVQMPDIFRNWMKPGDLVVVSKGNRLFRAIGEVIGGYEFHPRSEGDYGHRRKMRWLWVDHEGIPVSEIYGRGFSQKSVYQLTDSALNIDALERYMNSQQSDGPADPEAFVLIIDEINRANISKVFGELITLLEPDKRIGAKNELKVRLPYSGDEFGVPANLNILGTMNTADRSIALLDTALRRRFAFQEVMPEPTVLADARERCGLDLPRLLTVLNERIEYLFDREHQIGHAYFITCETREELDNVMRHKVIPLLAEYFFEDWGKVAAVLGDAKTHEGEIEGGFLRRKILRAPPGLEDDGDAAPRFSWSIRAPADGFDYSALLGT